MEGWFCRPAELAVMFFFILRFLFWAGGFMSLASDTGGAVNRAGGKGRGMGWGAGSWAGIDRSMIGQCGINTEFYITEGKEEN